MEQVVDSIIRLYELRLTDENWKSLNTVVPLYTLAGVAATGEI